MYMGKPFAALFSEFQGNAANPDDVQGSGDVEISSRHLDRPRFRRQERAPVADRQPLAISRSSTPWLGKVRAKQRQRGDGKREQVVGLLIHGDAAFAGQGWSEKRSNCPSSRANRTGGTIHFVVNNQIGFTTTRPRRSGPLSV